MPVIPLPAVSSSALWGCGLALLALVIFGCCMVAVSFLMRGMGSGPGSLLAAAAGVLAGLLAGILLLGFGASVEPPTLRAVTWFAVAGICSTYVGRWLVFKSIELMGPSRAAGVQCASPLVTAFFGWLLLGEALEPLGFFGMGLGIAGLMALNLRGQPQQASGAQESLALARQGGFVLASLVVGLGSAAAYSASHVLRAAGVREWNEPLLGASIGAVAGFATLLLASRRQLVGYIREIRAHRMGAAAYFGIGALQMLAQALVIASMKHIPAAVAGLISMATPLVVMPISYFVLRKQENLTLAVVLGSCITLSGIALVVLYGRAQH